jgi:hypothetical protein
MRMLTEEARLGMVSRRPFRLHKRPKEIREGGLTIWTGDG